MNNEKHDLKTLICPKCKIPEETLDMHERENCSLMIYKRNFPDVSSSTGFEVYPFICFECKNVTEIAIDPANKNIYEYVITREATDVDVAMAHTDANVFKLDIVKKKLDKAFN